MPQDGIYIIFDFFIWIVKSICIIQINENIELGDWLNSPLSNGLVIKRLIKVFKFLFKTEDLINNNFFGIGNFQSKAKDNLGEYISICKKGR